MYRLLRYLHCPLLGDVYAPYLIIFSLSKTLKIGALSDGHTSYQDRVKMNLLDILYFQIQLSTFDSRKGKLLPPIRNE